VPVPEPTPEPPSQVVPPAQAGGVHVIQSGDTLSSVARKSGVSLSALLKANPEVTPERLRIGQEIRIPSGSGTTAAPAVATPKPEPVETPSAPVATSSSGTYEVQSGDTPYGIARRHSISVESLLRENNISNPQSLQVGMKLRIPGGKTTSPAATPSTTSPAGNAPSKPAEPAKPRPPAPGTHIVKPNDTLFSIAQKTGTPIDELRKVNGLKDDVIHPGQSLKVRRAATSGTSSPAPAATPKPATTKPATPPAGSKSGASTKAAPAAPVASSNGAHMAEYTVHPGDSMFSIAKHFFLSREEIAAMNGLSPDAPLASGQKLRLPAAAIDARLMADNESLGH
jgi:LysM repeat protein